MTKNQQNEEVKKELTEEEICNFDKTLMKQRAVKTLFATAGTLGVAIPITALTYLIFEPFALMPPDVLGAIGFIVGLVVGLNTGWNWGLKKGREVAAKIKDE